MVAKPDFLLRFFSLQTDRSSFSTVLFLGSPFLSTTYVCFGFLCFFLLSGLGFYKTLPKRCTVRVFKRINCERVKILDRPFFLTCSTSLKASAIIYSIRFLLHWLMTKRICQHKLHRTLLIDKSILNWNWEKKGRHDFMRMRFFGSIIYKWGMRKRVCK